MHRSAQIQVGVAGLGRSGWSLHAVTLGEMTDKYRVAAVADPDAGRQEEAKSRFQCRCYSDYADMVADEEIELIVVASPSHLHEPFTVDALRAGKDVLVEKPFATSLQGADRMIEVARETGRLLTVGQNYRYGADYLKVRQVIDSGVLGRILHVRMAWHGFRRRWDWQTLKEFGGGSLNNSASHMVDIALLLMEDDSPDVFCHMEVTPLTSGNAEDHVKIVLKPRKGPTVDLEVMACAYPQDRWLVMGTQGSLVGDGSKFRWKYLDFSKLPPRPVSRVPTPDRSYNNEQYDWIEESADLKNEAFRSANWRLYEDLYETMRNGAPLAVTAESVRRQIAVLEKCRELSPI